MSFCVDSFEMGGCRHSNGKFANAKHKRGISPTSLALACYYIIASCETLISGKHAQSLLADFIQFLVVQQGLDMPPNEKSIG